MSDELEQPAKQSQEPQPEQQPQPEQESEPEKEHESLQSLAARLRQHTSTAKLGSQPPAPLEDGDLLIQQVCEGALLAAGKALSIEQLQALFVEHEPPVEKKQIKRALQVLQQACDKRGVELLELASGWRYQVRSNLSPWVNRLWQEKPPKYSRAVLETLALIAYRQPITRGEIEDIRGVAVSSNIIRTLVERNWIRTVGHKEVPGRPVMYATSKGFLDYFNLHSLDNLPSLQQLSDFQTSNLTLQLEQNPIPTASHSSEVDSSREATNRLGDQASAPTESEASAQEQEEN